MSLIDSHCPLTEQRCLINLKTGSSKIERWANRWEARTLLLCNTTTTQSRISSPGRHEGIRTGIPRYCHHGLTQATVEDAFLLLLAAEVRRLESCWKKARMEWWENGRGKDQPSPPTSVMTKGIFPLRPSKHFLTMTQQHVRIEALPKTETR